MSRGRFEARVRELIDGNRMMELVIGALLTARARLLEELSRLDREVRETARRDAVCRLLMTIPGVGPVVSLSFRAAVDDPRRFRSSKLVGVHFGLTPKKDQSGERDVNGAISKVGDASVRKALYEAANVMLTRTKSFSSLKRWALDLARQKGTRLAKVALARKLAVVMHRMGMDGTTFRWSRKEAATA